MGPVRWMVGASLAGLAVGSMVEPSARIDLLLGMLGPLAMAAITWVVVERTYREHPGRLTSVMVAAFAGKLVFFGAYVAIVLGPLSRPPVPFVVSFTSYFIALYLMEALYLRRLFSTGVHASR